MNDSTTHQDKRFASRAEMAAAAIIFLCLYGQYLIGYAPSGGDIVNQYLPYQELVRNAVRTGHWPLWNALTFCGRPLMGDIQVGVLYPPNWIHWIVPLPLGFALVLALHGAWMIAGCWKLGRRWGLAPPAIALGTALYAASPFFQLKMAQGIVLFIYVGAWWPWLALAVSRLVERPGFGRMAALAVALLMSLLAGSPQITFYGWIITSVLGVALPTNDQTVGIKKDLVSRVLWIGLAFVFAAGLSAIQTAQTSSFVGSSFERSAGAPWEYIIDGSFTTRLFWLMLNPGYLGNGADSGYYWGSRMDFAEVCDYLPLWAPMILTPLALVWLSTLCANLKEN